MIDNVKDMFLEFLGAQGLPQKPSDAHMQVLLFIAIHGGVNSFLDFIMGEFKTLSVKRDNQVFRKGRLQIAGARIRLTGSDNRRHFQFKTPTVTRCDF